MGFGPLPLEGFLDRVAAREPTPGGGTAAAVAGAMACALAEMVLGLTLGKPKFEAVQQELAPLLPDVRALRGEFLRLADADSRAYDAFLAASKLPKGTPEEQQARASAMRAAAEGAAGVPLQTAQCAVEALRILGLLVARANPSARSDALVGAQLAWAAFEGGRLNVEANLESLEAARAQQLRAEMQRLGKQAEAHLAAARGS